MAEKILKIIDAQPIVTGTSRADRFTFEDGTEVIDIHLLVDTEHPWRDMVIHEADGTLIASAADGRYPFTVSLAKLILPHLEKPKN